MTFTDYLSNHCIKYKENVDSSKISSIRAGGNIKLSIYPSSQKDLIDALYICKAFSKKFKIIGGCTNTFFSDEGFDGVVVFTSGVRGVDIKNGVITAECGSSLSFILRFAAFNGYEIPGELFGIPGTLGGAVRNNAGAYGKEIADVFIEGCFFDAFTGEIFQLKNDSLSFSYRYSNIQRDNILLLSAKLRAFTSSKEKCFEKFEQYVRKRRCEQPNLPSLGSFFKRSNDIIPAKLIDEQGLKGYTVGGASVSKKHSGFIVNSGNATADDIDSLARYIENQIDEKYGVQLIREAELVR